MLSARIKGQRIFLPYLRDFQIYENTARSGVEVKPRSGARTYD